MKKTITCTVTGLQYVSLSTDLIDALKQASALELVRQKDNPHDPNAIQVWLGPNRIGFLARRDAAILAPSWDNGSQVTQVKPGSTGHLTLSSRFFKTSVTLSNPGTAQHPLKPLKSICLGPGIYRIRSKLDNHAYVGQANRIDKRIQKHRSDLVMGVHPNQKLQALWTRSTPKDLAIEVLEQAPKGLSALDLQEWLGDREIHWIAQERERAQGKCLNIQAGGFVETKASEQGYRDYVKKYDTAVRNEKRKLREQLLEATPNSNILFSRMQKLEKEAASRQQRYKKATGWLSRLTKRSTEAEVVRPKKTLDAWMAEYEAVRLQYEAAAKEVNRLKERHRGLKTIKQLDNAFLRQSGIVVR